MPAAPLMSATIMMPDAMEATELPPLPELEPMGRQPRRQPVPELTSPVQWEPAGMDRLWYDYDEEPMEESAQRLWDEIDQIELPLEGEPHDLWWSTSKENSQ